MFKKIVSNLAFSPALIATLSIYAQRVRRESATRKIGLFLLIGMTVLQGVIYLLPPESANTTSYNDLAPGGITSIDDFKKLYRANEENLRAISHQIGITEADLATISASPATFRAQGTYTISREAQVGLSDKERAYTIDDTLYYQRPSDMPLHNSPSTLLRGWEGTSASLGWFAVQQYSGNIVLKQPLHTTPDLNPVETTVSSINASQGGIQADSAIAAKEDRIVYTVTLHNSSSGVHTTTPHSSIADILEYASLTDPGGSHLDAITKNLIWPTVTLQPGETQQRTFSVRIATDIPATAFSKSNTQSYDCILANIASNANYVAVQCPLIKTVERIAVASPPATPLYVLLGCIALTLISLYFYLRSRQLTKEIRIIRHNLNSGAL